MLKSFKDGLCILINNHIVCYAISLQILSQNIFCETNRYEVTSTVYHDIDCVIFKALLGATQKIKFQIFFIGIPSRSNQRNYSYLYFSRFVVENLIVLDKHLELSQFLHRHHYPCNQ